MKRNLKRKRLEIKKYLKDRLSETEKEERETPSSCSALGSFKGSVLGHWPMQKS